MDQGYTTFPGLEENIGAEMEFSRGITPSSCKIWLPVKPSLARTVGTLTFRDTSTQINFPNAAIAPGTLRSFVSRKRIIWTVVIRDRRWKWRYPVISGEYNVRLPDGSILESTRKTITELIVLLLGALGETSASISVPDGIYPHVHWNGVRAANQLAHLCELVGCIPMLKLDNTISIEPLGSGANLPTDNAINVQYSYNHAIMPSKVEVHGGPSLIQMKLPLKAVGLDIDGEWKAINDLSYKPADGWESQWYTSFSSVPLEYRHLAFETVFRCYQVDLVNKPVVPGTEIILTDLSQITLLPYAVQTSSDGTPLPPLVFGEFWKLDDLVTDTAPDTPYAGDFEVQPAGCIVKFDYPVTLVIDGELKPADIWLTTAFYAKGSDGEYFTEFAEAPVGASVHTTSPRYEQRKYMSVPLIIDSVRADGSTGSSAVDVRSELQLIATALASTYTADPAVDVWYAGLKAIDLDGAIAQVRFRTGNDKADTTRVSRHAEFSVFAPDYQERRRRERLTQITEAVIQ